MLSRVILSYHWYVVLKYQKSAKNKTPSYFRAPFNFRAPKKTFRAPLIFAHPGCANLPPLFFARPWCTKIKGARKFKGIRYLTLLFRLHRAKTTQGGAPIFYRARTDCISRCAVSARVSPRGTLSVDKPKHERKPVLRGNYKAWEVCQWRLCTRKFILRF